MGDNIDDVIQGILERARQRKDLLSKMVSKNSDSCLQDPMEDEVEKSNHKISEEIVTDEEPSKDKQSIIETPSKVTLVPDLSPGQPQLHSTPVTPKFESCDGSRLVENKVSSVAAKFSSLSEALNSKNPTNVNVIGGGITRVQKTTLNVANKNSIPGPSETTKLSAAERLGVSQSPSKEDEGESNIQPNVLRSRVSHSGDFPAMRSLSPTRQRGRLALASLASMYSEMDADSFGCTKESLTSNSVTECSTDSPVDSTAMNRSPLKSEEKCMFGLSRLVSKNSELVRRYANGGDHEDWNIKSGSSRNCTMATKPASTKRWTAPTTQTTASCFTPTSSFLPSKAAPTSHTRVANSEENRPTSVVSVPTKISVATTAKMFESSAASTGAVSPAAPTMSIAKARAAFFNSLAAGSTAAPDAPPSNNWPRNFNTANAKPAFTAPLANPASRTTPTPGGASLATILKSVATTSSTSVVDTSTSPSTATCTATTKLSLASRPPTSPASVLRVPLVPLKEDEEISPKNALKRKASRRDSWEDSKISTEVETDFVEEKKLGGDVEGATKEEDEEDDDDGENDAAINDEDFGDTSHDDSGHDEANDDIEMCSDDDDDESEDEFILTKPLLNEEINIMKDITNVVTPSKNSNSGNSVETTTPNKADDDEAVVTSPSKSGDDVTMRKTTKRRSGSFHKPRGYISLHEYRQLQQSRPKSQPPAKPRRLRNDENASQQHQQQVPNNEQQHQQQVPNNDNNVTSPYSGVVMRNKKLYPDLSSEITTSPCQSTSGGHKTIQQRITDLNDMINKELNIIHQTSNALNKCCHDLSSFAGSPEAVECHKLLLMACKKREAYVIEMQKLKALNQPQSPYPPGVNGPMGRLTISEIKLPMKADFMAKLGTSEDMTAHYFLLAVRHNNVLLFTQMTSTHEGQLNNKHHNRRRDYLEFPNLISLNNIEQDFQVDVEIFGMSITRMQDQGTPRKTPRKTLLTPRSSRRYESPAGPTSVRTTNFVHLASVHLDKTRVDSDMFTLDKVPRSSPLQSCMFMNVRCLMENAVHKKDFLTMFEDVSGFGAWHRRWFSLRNGVLSYWKYPDDELNKEPIGVIDLKTCITAHVGLVSRDVCAHPNTFEVETIRKQKRGDRNTLVQTCDERAHCTTIRYWLAADTPEDRKSWCSSLNEALMNLRAWHPDAARPTSKR